jgi:hypothetical protein
MPSRAPEILVNILVVDDNQANLLAYLRLSISEI